MKKIILVTAAFLTAFIAPAQKKAQLHTPAEIMKILIDSKVQYSLSQLESPIAEKDLSSHLVFNNFYRKITTGGFSTAEYKITKEVEQAVAKAEEAFQKNDQDEARKFYLKALELDSSYYMVMTYIGQTYRIQDNWAKAIEWYEKTIQLNYIDYMAHWFLADAYEAAGRLDDAKKEIIIAHILNRNNPRIRTALTQILQKNNLKLSDWVFNPQISISQKADNSIDIKYGEGWLIYALVKAIWAYEPGYRQSMGYENENVFRESEEKEGLIGLLLSEDPKTKSTPVTMALKKATEDKKHNMLQEFIYYEILFPEHPIIASQLPDEIIENIMDYILKVRCEKN